VPLNTDITCGVLWVECGDITHINACFWAEQVNKITMDDPELANDLQSRNSEDCAEDAREAGGWAVLMDGWVCEAERSAELWSDLALEMSQDQ
jgi:hypothetical protein